MIKITKNNAKAYYRLGICFASENKYSVALENFIKAYSIPGGNKAPSIPFLFKYFIYSKIVIKEIAKIELALDTEMDSSNPKTLEDYENAFLAKVKEQDEANRR